MEQFCLALNRHGRPPNLKVISYIHAEAYAGVNSGRPSDTDRYRHASGRG